MKRQICNLLQATWCAVSLLVLVASLMVAPTAGRAQLSSGSISGTVRDSSGAVIPVANIVLKNMETGFERSTQTNDTGTYVLLNILPGRYELRVSKEGFGSADQTGILV